MPELSPRRGALGLLALLLGIYLLSSGGHLYAIDEEQMYGLTEAIGRRGTLALNDPGPGEAPVYSTYGPGQSLVALPLLWAGQLAAGALPAEAAGWLTRAAAGWLNPIVTAVVGALIYLGARRLAGHRGALLAALAYGLGSSAWPHSKTFFAEPLNTLLWLGAFLTLWRPAVGPRAFALAGLLAGLAPAVKVQAAVALPLLGAYALWQAWRSPAPRRALLAWAAGAALPLAMLAGYNAALFGAPWRTGYGGSVIASFSAPFWEGFGGQLWGLRRGLIWCSPLLLLSPAGLVALFRRDRAAALLCAALPLSQLLLYATWYAWDGAGAWGPRFLNVALPFLCLPLAALAAEPRPRMRGARALGALALALSLMTAPVQLAALSINMNQVFTAPGGDAPSQIGAHLRLLAGRLGRAYERHIAPARLVLLSGFAPSEGAGAALLPRWSLPEARVVARAGAGGAALTLAADSCYAAPAPAALTLRLGGRTIAAHVPCPGRVYRALLPPGTSTLDLASPGWSPAAAGVARDDQALGIYLRHLGASGVGGPLRLVGDRLPAEPLPIDAGALRQRLGDPRVAIWDFWWAYLPLLPLPAAARALVATVWGGAALISLGVGLGLLLGPRRGKIESPAGQTGQAPPAF
jgi:hypothetical protein